MALPAQKPAGKGVRCAAEGRLSSLGFGSRSGGSLVGIGLKAISGVIVDCFLYFFLFSFFLVFSTSEVRNFVNKFLLVLMPVYICD